MNSTMTSLVFLFSKEEVTSMISAANFCWAGLVSRPFFAFTVMLDMRVGLLGIGSERQGCPENNLDL